MTIPRRESIALFCLGMIAPGAQAQTAAPAYPVKPIRIVVPAAPGGVTDVLARALGQRLTETWGQPAIVENRAGANNMIAAEHVARAAPDGYTLFVSPETTFVVNPALYSKLPYDAVRDFAPITGLVRINHGLVTHPSLPVKSVKELISLARAKPGEIAYGSFGTGSSGHLNMTVFQRDAGVTFTHVPYKGATPALADVMAGHIQAMLISVGSAVPQWKAGKVKLLAVGAAARMAQLPEVPTIAEGGGLPGFEALSWFALVTTAGTPRETVARVNGEVQRAFGDSAFREKFVAPYYFESITGSPEALAEHFRSEARKWSKVVQEAKVRLDQ
jgi:tripartite-type tricarboxylate transporter receptor subunit TctC